jgi:hypothetical protein
VAKSMPIREVRSMTMSCDPVGNLLLLKMAFNGGKEACVYLPAHIVFWLLKHLPVNQDPNLPPPPELPQVYAQDWDDNFTPRVFTVQCKQFADAIRMTIEFDDQRPDLPVLMNRTNVELMRQFMMTYKDSLMDLGLF